MFLLIGLLNKCNVQTQRPRVTYSSNICKEIKRVLQLVQAIVNYENTSLANSRLRCKSPQSQFIERRGAMPCTREAQGDILDYSH
jgi:hypothetical protein